ncbi:MAG: ElyC/SanA/YdcF family protein [Anaerolineaceae bacterium]
MLKKLRILLVLGCVVIFTLGIVRIAVILSTREQIQSLELAPNASAAIVLGAGLNADGTPSLPLRDRVAAGSELYQSGKVQKLLMSGDNREINYNEPEAMRQYALSLGIPDEDIVLDYAGRSTYDTCYRAGAIFGLEDVIVVTQAYHLPRAVFLCSNLGLKVTGVPVEQSGYLRSRYLFWNFREIFATLAAVWDVYVARPLPVLGDPEPIFSQ